MPLEPAFLEGFDRGRRFSLWVRPQSPAQPRGRILCVQPFGDEAPLSRRVLVAQALRLADDGWTTLIVDLFGTGDSDGETHEAQLDHWQNDLAHAWQLLAHENAGPLVVWGTRMGALIACEAAPRLIPEPSAWVFWQPVIQGSAVIGPLMRLAKLGALARTAAAPADALQAPGDAPAASLRGPVASQAPASTDREDGGLVNLGGYNLSHSMVSRLNESLMKPPPGRHGGTVSSVLFLGLQRAQPAAPNKALAEQGALWESAGHRVRIDTTKSEPFWASMEPSTPLDALQTTEGFLKTLHD